ncbi:CRISPR-associated protein Cas4 (plasmid) [Tundrisphaera sp. TA3]|uniref:CRISPR-associated protein Cas4 n=1 Tax=Tundrisphaera sp. TA3 TaxID=3435775 RepID=UPI003EB7C7C9
MVTLYRVAYLLLLLGVVLVVLSRRGRKAKGLGDGQTVALDNVTLFSERLGLVGRPDRIVKVGEAFIPEEWKSSKKVSHGHKLQLATYFLLIEEEYGVRPAHGFVVLGDGSRHEVENTESLRSEALAIAEKIREHRMSIGEEIRVRQPLWTCRVCGQRAVCVQSSVKS